MVAGLDGVYIYNGCPEAQSLVKDSRFSKHVTALLMILQGPDSYALIIDDNVMFYENFKNQLYKFILLLPYDFDLLYIGGGEHVSNLAPIPSIYLQSDSGAGVRNYKQLTKWGFSTVISKNCAKKIISELISKEQVKIPMEEWIEKTVNKLNCKIYWSEPHITY